MISEQVLQNPAARELNDRAPDAIVDAKDALGEITLWIEPSRIVEVCGHFRRDQKFERISGITAVDSWPADPRFEVVYHLHSLERNLRIRLKCRVSGPDPEIDSVTSVWRGANWYEREVFDMFGIRFRNHPDLKRILMPEDWQGHPLRKDYPVHGHKYDYQND